MMMLSRRGLLRGALAPGVLLAAGGAPSACGTKGTKQAEASRVSEDLSAIEKTINFSNWPLYLDIDEKDESKRPTLDAFQAQIGITMTYTEDVNDNDEYLRKRYRTNSAHATRTCCSTRRRPARRTHRRGT